MSVDIILLDKKSTGLNSLFKEVSTKNGSQQSPEDIYYNPVELLDNCGLKDILTDKPFNNIRTAGSVWEFYLLRFADDISRSRYRPLIKSIPRECEPIAGCSRRRVGNPYNTWESNYPEIDDSVLRSAAKPFANKIVSRKLPVRQARGDDFKAKRRNAAKVFFNYLIGINIKKNLLAKLQECENFQEQLILLLKKYPDNDLFVTSGLMVCLYGGRKKTWVDARLASAVANSLSKKSDDASNDYTSKVCSILMSKRKNKDFRLPYHDIYDPRRGNRERVNINFRIQTWLKLLEDTGNASK